MAHLSLSRLSCVSAVNQQRGEPTGAMYGVLNMLQPDRISRHMLRWCLTPKGKTFRDEL